jgi:hypothetical protein
MNRATLPLIRRVLLHVSWSGLVGWFFNRFLLNTYATYLIRSRDSSVGIATGYGLDDWGTGVRVPVDSRIFSTSSISALGSIQPPIQWVTEALSPGVKRPVLEADHLHPTSADVKKMWMYTSTPPYAFMAWCLISKVQGQRYRLLIGSVLIANNRLQFGVDSRQGQRYLSFSPRPASCRTGISFPKSRGMDKKLTR